MGSGGLRQPGGILARNRDLPRRQASTLFGAVAIRVRGASRSWIQSPDVSASGPVRRRRTACGRASSVYGCLEVRTPGHLLPRIEAWNARGLGPLGVLARSGCFVGAQIDRLLSDQIKGISAVTKLPTLPRADPLAECDDDVSFAAENSETLLLASSGVILNHGGAGSGIPQQ